MCKSKNIRLLLLFVSLVNCLAFASPLRAEQAEGLAGLEKVRLQLKWEHQFQFAGYYAAIEQGYYRDVGLEVELLERSSGQKRAVDLLLAGQATYAIEGANVLISRIQGQPLVALAAVFQHSPAVAISLQENRLTTAKSMVGKRFMTYGADTEIPAMLLKEGIDLAKITWLPTSYTTDSLLTGETDLSSAYLTNEPFFLEQQKIPYSIINPINYGIDFYGDILFTSEQEIIDHPGRVKAFRTASLKGWKYALSHPEEVVDLILATYSQKKSREHLLYEARESIRLIAPDAVEIGHLNPGRLEHMAKVLKQLGQVEKTEGLNGFVYTENMTAQLAAEELAWLQQRHRVRVFVAHAPPLVFVKGDRVEGLVIDYLKRLTTDFGVQFDYEQSSWSEAVAGVVGKSGPDLLPIISPASERRKLMALSDPFLSMPSVIFTRDDSQFVGGVEDLRSARVAMPEGFLLHELFEKEYPDIKVVLTSSMRDALMLLATGKVEAYIGGLMMTSHLVQEMGLENIKVAAPFPLLPAEHVLAVRSDWPELSSLFNRIIHQMSPQEHAEIRQRWSSMHYEYGVSREEIWRWSGSALVVFLLGSGLFILWNRSLKREIVRRKSTEEALVTSVKQHQSLLHAIPHGIIEVDPALEMTYCNPSFSALLGYQGYELCGKPLAFLLADETSKHELNRGLDRIRSDRSHLRLKLQLLDKARERLDVQFDLDISTEAPTDRQVIIVTDLTHQGRIEKSLLATEAFYRTTFANIQAGVVHLTIDSRILRANPFLCRLLGYSESELMTLSLGQITHPEDMAASFELLQQLKLKECESYSLAKRYLKKNGSPVWVLVSVSLQQQEQGEEGYVVVVQDIDDFKHQQDEVTAAAANLEEIIQERTLDLQQRIDEVGRLNAAMLTLADDLQRNIHDLNRQKAQLVAANADLESFSFSVSHDLRSPLRHISGFVAILQESCAAQLDDSAQSLLQVISASASKMEQMIDDILEFSRVGRVELMKISIDMNLLFAEVCAQVAQSYPELSITWQIDQLPRIEGDVVTLRQMVTNLLDNAVKYSAKEAQPTIEVSCRHGVGEYVISIRDNGVGFDPTYADKLFKAFQRLHHEKDFSGTGIGLASVNRIVERHGGWVRGESVAGQGACFTVGLPDGRGGDDASKT